MSTTSFNATDLITSFRAGGAWIDDGAIDLVPVLGMGIGAVAKRPIEPHTPLFHIPLAHLLTPWTSSLRTHLTAPEWHSLAGGWTRLILCMMWEESRPSSPWASYLRNMPASFATPMFWPASERAALLAGTDIAGRIGRDDAEREYAERIVPLLRARPELFGGERAGCFALERFHVQGSRVLSRSFMVAQSRAGGPAPGEEDGGDGAEKGNDDDDDDEEEEDDVAVMVPMADMLNAAYERDNARLFADGDEDEDGEGHGEGEGAAHGVGTQKHDFGEGYTMITTKAIGAGEQVYNTYASPPNSELLRKYGHVDTLPLPAALLARLSADELCSWHFGNPGDEVEISGDLVVASAAALVSPSNPSAFIEAAAERVDWWLEEGQEDVFGLSFDADVDADDADEHEESSVAPPALVAFARLLCSDDDWARATGRGKLPSVRPTGRALAVVAGAIRRRAEAYPAGQTLAGDVALAADAGERENVRNAAAVRVGEKRLLSAKLRGVEEEGARLERREREDAKGKRKAARREKGEERREKRRK